MKLVGYLADYLANGIEKLHRAGLPMDFTTQELESIIEQGIKAFESTGNVKVKIEEN